MGRDSDLYDEIVPQTTFSPGLKPSCKQTPLLLPDEKGRARMRTADADGSRVYF